MGGCEAKPTADDSQFDYDDEVEHVAAPAAAPVAPKPSSAVMQEQLNADIDSIEDYVASTPAPAAPPAPRVVKADPTAIATSATANLAAQDMEDENTRRKAIAAEARNVTGNASWVGDVKNAQEAADAQAAQAWCEAVTGQPFVNGDLWETTKSGVYLCNLINIIQPDTVVGKIKESKMPFSQMEMIGEYIKGCDKIKVRDVFRPPDLYEKRVSYPRAIINNIHALAKVAKKINKALPVLHVETIKGHAMGM